MPDFLPPERPPTAPLVPLQQSPEFARALGAMGRPCTLGHGPAASLLLWRNFAGGVRLSMAPRILLGSRSIAEHLSQAGLPRTPVIVSPDHPAPDLADQGAIPLVSPAIVAEVDLCQPADARRANLDQKWRNRLNHAGRQGLTIKRSAFPNDPSHWLLAADAKQQRDRRYRNWPSVLTLAYARANPGQAMLFTAYQDSDPVAAMLFLRHGGTATYHIGHTTGKGRRCNAHNLILWTAADWLANHGHARLDLGLVNGEDAPGLARFKLGAGARARPLGGTWLFWPLLGRVFAPLARMERRVMSAGSLDKPNLSRLNEQMFK